MDEAFWECPRTVLEKDAFFFISVTMNCFSLVLNFVLLVLLFILKGKCRMFLFNLRAMLASIVLHVFLRISNRIIPKQWLLTESMLAPFICYVVLSHYLFFMTHTFAILILTFTVENRAIQIVCRYQYSYSTSLIANLSYMIGFGLVSLICLIPQALIVQWDDGNCTCRDTGLSYEMLLSYYTGTYLRLGLTAGICTIILGISCYKIISWVRNTPPAQLYDTWNLLELPGTSKEQQETLHRPQGWLTASLCTVPLSVNFLIGGIYEAGYNCLCAAGFCKIQLATPVYKIGRLLGDLRMLVLPIILIIYIPALRALSVGVCQKMGQKLCRRRGNVDDRGQPNSRGNEVQSPLPS